MKAIICGWMLMMISLGAVQTLIPVSKEELFANPSLISAKISPDGKTIAYVGADEKGISNVYIYANSGSLQDREQISFFNTPEIIQFFWSGDSQRVLLLKERDGIGKLQLHGIHIGSKEHVIYTEKFPNANAKIIQISSKKNSALIGLNHRNPHFHDLYLLDLDSGAFELFFTNDRYAKFLGNDSLDLVLKIHIDEEDGSWTVFTASDDIFLKLTSAEAFQTEFLAYSEKSQSVFLLDNRFSDLNQLIAKSLSGDEKVLAAPSNSDVDEVLFIGGEPKAYASYYEKKKWHAIDPSVQSDLAFLENEISANFEIVNSSEEGNLWMVSNSSPDRGKQFWLYDRKTRSLSALHSGKENSSYSKMYSLIVTARDGQELVCYYTLPREVDLGGFVERPIPLVVVPHGGPFKVRDKFQFNPYHQWLAGCGYAALSVNFRLSSGFGKAFINAGNGEWGGKAHLDVIDAVETCIAKGITAKGKLAIFGGSYGGYESLASLTLTPEYFACCIAICGPSSLKTVLENLPKFWEFTAAPLSDKMMFFTKQAFVTSMGGSPDDPKAVQHLQNRSPLNHLEKIQAPLLLVHGKNDHVVAQRESEQIYKSMKERGKKINYILFPDEGHRFARFANKMMYLDAAERFLSQHLGGSYHPVQPDILADSSAQILD